VRCWGGGYSGQLGYGNLNPIGDNELPETAGNVNVGAGVVVVQVSAGGSHTCVVLDDGGIMCWGSSIAGQLGYGNKENVGASEDPAAAGTVDLGSGAAAAQVSAGKSHTCAVLTTGLLMCWGFGSNGRLGYGNTNNIGDNEHPSAAGAVNLGAGLAAAQVSAGDSHTCAVLTNGGVMCWGTAFSGRLGYSNFNHIGDNEHPAAAGQVNLGGGRAAARVAAGQSHTCVLLTSGE
ncbi:HERC6, partial [Symbiodinium sp. KB8]